MDKPGTGTVPMTGCCVKLHKQMAAGQKITGQTLPAGKMPAGPKTPA